LADYLHKYIKMKSLKAIIVFIFLIFHQLTYAQVDVIYNDLVWSDEFNTNGAINNTNWHHQTQIPAGGSWYNGEVQHYTNLLSNSFVENGVLKIVAKKQTFADQGSNERIYLCTIKFQVCIYLWQSGYTCQNTYESRYLARFMAPGEKYNRTWFFLFGNARHNSMAGVWGN
jgi:hypothetical protein